MPMNLQSPPGSFISILNIISQHLEPAITTGRKILILSFGYENEILEVHLEDASQ